MVNLTNLNKEDFEAVSKFWNDAMPMKAMEECGEFIQALSKYEVFVKSSHPDMDNEKINQKAETFRNKLIDEIRDVYISLEAIKIMYDIDDNELNGKIEMKINKKY